MTTDKQIILVTGASSGVGLETSYALAAASPNNHVLMGVRNLTKGTTCLKELQSRNPPGTLALIELDVTIDDSITAAVEKIESDYGRLDVLINNAGIEIKSPTAKRADMRAIFETNVYGPTLLTQALVPLLKKSPAPKVINVTSGLGSLALRTDPTHHTYHVPHTVYRMSKSALNMLTACQHKEMKEWGCKVWCYCPGFVVTNLTGEEERQWRSDSGGESPETSATGIVEVVEGKRDVEVGLFITKYGGRLDW
ncbi:NAD(P)-binding protein [Byssothecium circinans]|uniref:NAD(P)-binding protein n=1 Tax=Byssothecium circinans TaxID=147558 RepID=A0A6A5TRH0_9PLEO|nr:NAD(P)-binding protein [Byssothecium circinans]